MTDTTVTVIEDEILIVEVSQQGPPGPPGTGGGGGGPSMVPVSVFNGGSPEIVFDDTGEVVLTYVT